jgi:hypothetical protein
MHWIDETEEDSPNRPHHVLIAEQGESLESVFVVYWKRILTEGLVLPRASRESLGIEILARDEDEVGAATAIFYTSRHEENKDAARYILRCDDLVCARGENEDHRSFVKTHLVWQLKQYVTLKQALQHPEVWPLFEKINASGPLRVQAAAAYDHFDLRPGQKEFGTLSASDQSALAGLKPSLRDALRDLGMGIVDIP